MQTPNATCTGGKEANHKAGCVLRWSMAIGQCPFGIIYFLPNGIENTGRITTLLGKRYPTQETYAKCFSLGDFPPLGTSSSVTCRDYFTALERLQNRLCVCPTISCWTSPCSPVPSWPPPPSQDEQWHCAKARPSQVRSHAERTDAVVATTKFCLFETFIYV